MTVDLEQANGSLVRYGVLAIFALNGDTYAAMIPLQDDGEPVACDVTLMGCEWAEGSSAEGSPAPDDTDEKLLDDEESSEDLPDNGDEDVLYFYDIDDRDEYDAVTAAFQQVINVV